MRVQVARLGRWRHGRLLRSSGRIHWRRQFAYTPYRTPTGLLPKEDRTLTYTETTSTLTVELLDQALAQGDLDASWNLILRFLPTESDPGIRVWMDRRPKQFLGDCLRMQRSDLVFAFLRRYPPDNHLFAMAMKQCLKLGRFEDVCQLTELLYSLGIAPDAYTYNAQISALSKLGRLKQAREAFDAAVTTGHGSIHVYNTMLDAYARVNQLDACLDLWAALEERGMMADSVSYVALLRAWGNQGRFDTCRELFAEMLQKRLKPMPHTYTVLFDCITKTGASVDVSWLMQLVQEMESHQVWMNQHILSAMINAFSLQELNAEHLEFVFSTVSAFRAGTRPKNKVYSTLLNFCGRRGIPERAMDVWQMLKEDGGTPNGHVYSAVLKTCCQMKLHQKTFRFVSEIARQLISDWTRDPNTEIQSEMRGAFNALLHFYVEAGKRTDLWSTYQSMKQHGPSPDHITYNTVLSALTGADCQSDLQLVMEDMQSAGFARDVQTYSILLNSCAERHDVDQAVAYLQDMEKKGYSPAVECYTCLIDACVKEGSTESLNLALETFTQLKQKGLQPTAVTYGCLLMAYQARGDVNGAFELYQEACRAGVSPSDRCHNVLISMCTEVGRLDDALELIKVLVRTHGDIAEDTMNSITRALSAEYLPRSLVLLRLMKHRAMVPKLQTYSCLVLACCRDSSIQQAFSLYREMLGHKMDVRQEVGSALIASLSRANEVLAALRVTNDMFEKAGLPSIDSSSINKASHSTQAPTPSRRKERIIYSALPTVISLGALIVALAQKNRLKTGMYVFRQICVLDNGAGVMTLTKDVPQVFELLMESSCGVKRVDWAVEVFLKWSIAAEQILKSAKRQKTATRCISYDVTAP